MISRMPRLSSPRRLHSIWIGEPNPHVTGRSLGNFGYQTVTIRDWRVLIRTR
jgi:hypothetical protein